jgi:tetratricopeptide (TPR) repeat protein
MVKRTGNPVMEAFYMNNIGEIALEKGRLEEAETLLTGAWEIWRAAGYRSGVAYDQCNFGRVACAQARYEDALRLFEQSRDESHSIGGHSEALEADARMTACLLLSGRPGDALALVAEALDRARFLGGVSAQTALLYRVRGAALLATAELGAARQALPKSLDAARARRASYEEASPFGFWPRSRFAPAVRPATSFSLRAKPYSIDSECCGHPIR